MITDPNVECRPGDILHSKTNKNENGIPSHYIIYIGPHPTDNNIFIGAMLTHSSLHGNAALSAQHFEVYDENGMPYRVQYDRSHISQTPYFKKMEWSPFTKEGQLTTEGIQFLKGVLGFKTPQFFPHNKK